jgi:para-nitrobenzyl esterase
MVFRSSLESMLVCVVSLSSGALVFGCGSDDGGGTGGSGGTGNIQEGTEITLDDGTVAGELDGATRRFLGIPFAAPPTGELRWEPPQPPQPWDAPLDATEFSPACPQIGSLTSPGDSTNEDCLYLNVWTPDPAPTAPLPVMVWFHGGSNVTGSTADTIPFVEPPTLFYNGRGLVEEAGVVVVTANYRLGVMGFFAHEAISAESPDSTSGNQGLLDQRMALQWVRDNIEAFGGNPDDVTIFGESAGAFDVCFQVASPGSRGLFHRAISQSGGCTTALRTRQTAEAEGDVFAAAMGCGDAADVAECLRNVPVADLLTEAPIDGAQEGLPGGDVYAGGTPRWEFTAIVDGTVLPEQPRALFESGDVADVPYILGSNSDEGTLFHVLQNPVANDEEYLAALERRFGATLAAQVAAEYPTSNFASPEDALERITGDAALVCSTRDTAKRAANAGLPVFMYNFARPIPIPGLESLRATHGAEIAYVFGSVGPDLVGQEDLNLSMAMRRYWGRFAANGDPNGGGDPQWPMFSADDDVRINFDVSIGTVDDFRSDVCAFWESVYDQAFQ